MVRARQNRSRPADTTTIDLGKRRGRYITENPPNFPSTFRISVELSRSIIPTATAEESRPPGPGPGSGLYPPHERRLVPLVMTPPSSHPPPCSGERALRAAHGLSQAGTGHDDSRIPKWLSVRRENGKLDCRGPVPPIFLSVNHLHVSIHDFIKYHL